ncbi:MAG: Riboflavin biosynthesis protein RibBA [Saprospiraceae bacterium]|jgi:3,4-dihydroxy 2-butanone 4-phosphate synthase/GTP cyclohydrolase II|nr:Riboflavin biosynthesis protein RibBA [Saprospiraceae bacterium]
MTTFNTIEEAIQDFRQGKILIVVDNEDRENEGDFICAAETITPELVNFMASHGRGLLCAPLEEARADALQLPLMVRKNTSLHETAFTVSVDLIGNGCTTGISTRDRCLTIQALANEHFQKDDFARPGHIFPLRAKPGGVLQRAGHTEAVIDMARLAGMAPAGALIEILNEDGSMARLPQLFEKSGKFDLKIISIHDLIEYRLKSERLIQQERTMTESIGGTSYRIVQFRQTNTEDIHLAFIKGTIDPSVPCSVRVQYADLYVELVDVLVQSENSMLRRAFDVIEKSACGILVLLCGQERTDKPLLRLEPALPEVQRTEYEQREIGIGAQILRDLSVGKMIVLSNFPRKHISLEAYGLEIVGYAHY